MKEVTNLVSKELINTESRNGGVLELLYFAGSRAHFSFIVFASVMKERKGN